MIDPGAAEEQDTIAGEGGGTVGLIVQVTAIAPQPGFGDRAINVVIQKSFAETEGSVDGDDGTGAVELGGVEGEPVTESLVVVVAGAGAVVPEDRVGSAAD